MNTQKSKTGETQKTISDAASVHRGGYIRVSGDAGGTVDTKIRTLAIIAVTAITVAVFSSGSVTPPDPVAEFISGKVVFADTVKSVWFIFCLISALVFLAAVLYSIYAAIMQHVAFKKIKKKFTVKEQSGLSFLLRLLNNTLVLATLLLQGYLLYLLFAHPEFFGIGSSGDVSDGLPAQIVTMIEISVLRPMGLGPQHIPLVTGIAFTVTTAITIILLYYSFRKKPAVAEDPIPESADGENELHKTIDKSIRLLGESADIREAVIECYTKMCALFNKDAEEGIQGKNLYAEAAKIDPLDSLTAREYAKLLAAIHHEDPEIAALTAVFEKARYSEEPCSETDRQTAIDGLKALRERNRETFAI